MTSSAKARQSITSQLRSMVRQVIRAEQVPIVVHAVVTAAASGVVTIKQQGSPTTTPNIRYLSSYSPTVGDTVVCFNVAGDLWVVGKIV